jgi:hypothetical protein
MEWMTIKEAAKLWGLSVRRATILCTNGKVDGAQKLGSFWVVPKGIAKPIDGRTREAKKVGKKEIES